MAKSIMIQGKMLKTLEALCGVPMTGVIPYTYVDIDDEDSLTARLGRSTGRKLVDIAVIRLPRISNFTDFSPFERYRNVSVRYVDGVDELHQPDMIIDFVYRVLNRDL